MKTVGVIVEYNPFHNGHKYHLQQAKKICGANSVIAITSGNFVQRGIPSITDKYTKTKMALANGVDVVYELPTYYATASAETFAYGAVSILHGLGTIDFLCFGAEDDNLPLMKQIAQLLISEPVSYKEQLKKELSLGNPFPVARKNALLPLISGGDATYLAHFLESSNNILGIEYIKALYRLKSNITPVIVKRKGSLYNEEGLPLESSLPSATALRKHYSDNHSLQGYASFVPDSVLSLLESTEGQTFPILLDDFSEYLYYKLLSITYEDLITYADVSSDLAKRILNLRNQFTTISEFSNLLKTRQVTLTRIQRVLLHVLLDIKKEQKASIYARLLGFKKEATYLIQKKSASIPILTKVGNHKELLEDDIRCTDLYNRVVLKKFNYEIPNDYIHPLVIEER